MSTTVTPTTPKASKFARRNNKPRNSTPMSQIIQHNDQLAEGKSTPPLSSPNSSGVEDGTTGTSSASQSEQAANKRNGRLDKKNNNRNSFRHSPAPKGSGSHRHTASQPSTLSPIAVKDSQRYAGPTFHASPAPSALPMPTFFSKSVPNGDLANTVELQEENSPPTEFGEETPSKKGVQRQIPDCEPASSPLDFLFKVAREAQSTNSPTDRRSHLRRGSLPYRPEPRTPNTVQPMDGSSGGIFSFELDGADTRKSGIGPSFATPYKERMDALRSASSPLTLPDKTPEPNEEQRKAKTEELKTLLLNPKPQTPALPSPRLRDLPNIFCSRSSTPGYVSRTSPSPRHSSGPATPVPFEGNRSKLPYNGLHDKDIITRQYLSSVCQGQLPSNSSHLRREMSPNSAAGTPTSDPQNHRPFAPGQNGFHVGVNNFLSPTPNRVSVSIGERRVPPRASSARLGSSETKRIEDDLRRILKLGVGESGGIRSTVV